jgi:hypothetical protein
MTNSQSFIGSIKIKAIKASRALDVHPIKTIKASTTKEIKGKNGSEGSSKSRFEPEDLNLCRITLFCLRQLPSIGSPNKNGIVILIPYDKLLASPEVYKDPIYSKYRMNKNVQKTSTSRSSSSTT